MCVLEIYARQKYMHIRNTYAHQKYILVRNIACQKIHACFLRNIEKNSISSEESLLVCPGHEVD